MSALQKRRIFLIASLLFCVLAAAACDTLMESFRTFDTQSATLTAMVSPTVMVPTLDLKGNEVIGQKSGAPYEVVCVSLLEDRPNGGIMNWSDSGTYFAYTAPTNRYWGWFSGDAVVLDLAEDPENEYGFSVTDELSTEGYNVFGNYAFSPDNRLLAFTALRQSEKLYTVMTAELGSGLKTVKDLFPGGICETDSFASEKSVIGWVSENELRVSSSCGIDCEHIYLVNVQTGSMTLEEDTRKNGHSGRDHSDHVLEYDDRRYPVMNQANWAPNDKYIFYTDNRDQAWVINDETKQQFELPVNGGNILQTLWSADSRYLALRYEDRIRILAIDF